MPLLWSGCVLRKEQDFAAATAQATLEQTGMYVVFHVRACQADLEHLQSDLEQILEAMDAQARAQIDVDKTKTLCSVLQEARRKQRGVVSDGEEAWRLRGVR